MPETGNQVMQKRQVAHKVRIKEVVSGEYVKEEGWNPNYIVTEKGKHISRANIIATIVQKSVNNSNYKNIVLDDGSSKISVRSFENSNMFNNIDIGDVTLVIGRPRQFGQEKYILAEIIKKIDQRWIQVRKLELEKQKGPEIKSTVVEEIKEDTGTKTPQSDTEIIFNVIKENDKGEGADIEEVISKSKINEAEKIITRLLEGGDLFEVKSGRLKVLE